MATLLRGKLKGVVFKINQYANDWVTDGMNNVYHITSVRFTIEELSEILSSGTIMKCFRPDFETLTFKRIRNETL